jgi:hypothetical protein
MSPRITNAFIFLSGLLPEIVGPGGFVRTPPTGTLQFWRDPRSAHVTHPSARAAHHALRPVLKVTDDQSRLQIVSLGWTASRIDRTIKYGLLLLLASAVQHRARLPRLAFRDLRTVLHAPPGAYVPFEHGELSDHATRLDLFSRYLDEVLEPEHERAEGAALQCGLAIAWAREAIRLLKAGDPSAIAPRLPLSWAIKHHVFECCHAAAGICLPVHGEPPSSASKDHQITTECAILSILEADILGSDVRQGLFQRLAAPSFPFDQVYGQDPDVVRSLAEDRLPSGAAGSAPLIDTQMHPPPTSPTSGDPRALTFCDWTGNAHAFTPGSRPRTILRILQRLQGVPGPGTSEMAVPF